MFQVSVLGNTLLPLLSRQLACDPFWPMLEETKAESK